MDERRLSILYIKLQFSLVFQENTVLPEEKVSALRGGMGEMLLRQNCVSDRICEECIFESACIVRKTMYTHMEKKPSFMQGNDSIGYLIECEDYRTNIKAGDTVGFSLTLFGNNIVYFGQYLQAFSSLGMYGLGKNHSRYEIQEIRNMYGQSILKEDMMQMEYFTPEYVSDYVERRREDLYFSECQNTIIFHTPLSLKFHGEYLQKYSAEAVMTAILRRIMMLDYFCGIYEDYPECEEFPEIVVQRARKKRVYRYSSTQDSKVCLTGIEGFMVLDEIPGEYLDYILAGELLHIGKNSSFGFGRYELK